ncbi:cytochrome P450 [Gymnopilus junonius]|uniref:Cytochrome P450 n=1 Tax=Gymnopilus junonius TaxID=109634 RepID=A0A9P5NQ33_GYMJU|nr:cytochrome P450 [Gymnopilus junonius]
MLVVTYRRARALPPGPRDLLVLGNIFEISKQTPCVKLIEWAREFGPIYSLNIADGNHIAFAHYGTKWKKMRRAAHEGFNVRATKNYEPVLSREAAFATIQMLKSPKTWADHLNRVTAGGILAAVYGWPPLSDKAELFIENIHAHVSRLTESAAPGAHLVEIIPVLKYAPLWMAEWKREGMEWHQRETEIFEGLIKDVQDEMRLGSLPQCFVSNILQNKDRHQLTDKEAAWLSGIEFSAGAGTTSTTLLYFIQAMVLYPDVMHKAHSELDIVIGRDRIPTFDDQENLVYVEAIVKEVLRWRPVGPLAVPRRVIQDDWYDEYLIPKGATVITNIWIVSWISRDPKIFSDFDDFRPERFFDAMPEDTHSMGHATYSFGRRMCAGYNFANQTLFITIATILWALNIHEAKDEDGKPVLPSKHDFLDTGLIVAPVPFMCEFSPRFPGALSALQREMPDDMREQDT